MKTYVLGFHEIDKGDLPLVGEKGLNLGELSKIEGVRVPAGFCVTTDAYQSMVGQNEKMSELLDRLCQVKLKDKEQIAKLSQEIRDEIENVKIDREIEEAIRLCHSNLGENEAYAVRSSATAEDLPNASFAGQQDSYLNIIGIEAILQHVTRCWASLFTERAVTYRIQHRFDHRKVQLSVVIQQMVFPEASGILFTADPATSNRNVLSIDASFGLGEALVSGLVTADNYKVRGGRIADKTVSAKKTGVYALKGGGTEERGIEDERQNVQALADEQIVQLESIGRMIETHFDSPQDIEWCLADDLFYVVQSRPITTLFPIPEKSDGRLRVYVSVGHQQMMTEPINPLGISLFSMLSEYELSHAGGRLFIDLSHDLASAAGRKIVLAALGKNDPLMHNALTNVIKRKELVKSLPKGKRMFKFGAEGFSWSLPADMVKVYRKNDIGIAKRLISKAEASIKTAERNLQHVSGDELFEALLEDQKELKNVLHDKESMAVIMVGIFAAYWINKKMEKWLGEKSAADALSQSVPNNITSEMGLALLDVADAVRQYPEVLDYLKHPNDAAFFEDLEKLEGGADASAAFREFLDQYGMRCTGEIDITKTRWSERPSALIPLIESNIKHFEPGARTAKFEQGKLKADQKEKDLLSRLEKLKGGRQKAKKTKKMISVLRNYIGYREYPKYALIKRFFIYKKALLKEAAVLEKKKLIKAKEDVYYLSFDEFRNAVRTGSLDYRIIEERKAAYQHYEKLTPPRLMTSEGEVIFGEYNSGHLPEGALAGIPVSAGVIEGRARVVLKMEEADIEEGDILVTAFTDPSWTPLFVSVKGLVTEVGGLMTHGAVIAREYGLPAVVGVEHGTKEIKDGQRIRINGSEGYVKILE
ncbi:MULTISPECIES: phosphoenolpyruvate synthase [Bacillus]|uniref:phosphoenolpyruvate synthase n=1 Tax=Bacillus TaxID=1386 RepID=UPI0015813C97|nr:phosphoenolpyruvate synthase [Bacillus glycinifermentans]MBU8786552.1 phosphoenolpyruvate synthase [Bacillus glycinifermentans]NUJ16473.1 phosphoenolpyruvate synthase [Bacillus glycinifermentans]